jgi:hypothetical protein
VPLATFVAVVLAQQGHQEPSLEWLVARSAVVIRASVADVSKELLPNDRAWIIVTLKVHETLKGLPPETPTFAEDSSSSDRRYEGWRDAGRELLVFLLKNPKYKPDEREVETRFPLIPYGLGWTVIRLGPAVPQEKGWTEVPSALFRNNLEVLEDPAKILEAANRAVAAGRGAVGEPRKHELSLPRSVMEWSGRCGDSNHLIVPVDSQLETLARELIQSPTEVLSKRGNSTAKRDKALYMDGYWDGRKAAAKSDDDRRQVQAERDSRNQRDLDELRDAGRKALDLFKSNEKERKK